MAQDVTINGASYPDVPSVKLPKTTGGGFALFVDKEQVESAFESYDITWIADHYISKYNGTVNEEVGSSCSDFLEISSSKLILFTNTMTYDTDWNAFYNSDKQFISGFMNDTGIITAPSNAKYFRLSKKTNDTLVAKYVVDAPEVVRLL